MKWQDAAGSRLVTPSWVAREKIDNLKKEVKDERETKEDK